jgi:hypothetical protein
MRRAGRLALLPFWAAQLATGAKSFRDNPIMGDARLNALGLHVARQNLARHLAARRRARLAPLISPEHAAVFARDGYVMAEGFLPPPVFAALCAQVRTYRGPAREMAQGDTITRRLALHAQALRQMPDLAQLLQNPVWQGLLRYAGSHDKAPVCYLQTILSGALPGPPDPQTALHSDTFHATAKAWLTLTDVAADAAPFVYVPGSHILTPARREWERRMSQEAAGADRLTGRGSFRIQQAELAALGYAAPKIFAVPANTLIVADTSGFHARGFSAAPSQRIEVWAYARANPFFSLPFDLWSLPALGDQRAPLFWRYGDALERLGVKPQGWRRRDEVSAFDPAA